MCKLKLWSVEMELRWNRLISVKESEPSVHLNDSLVFEKIPTISQGSWKTSVQTLPLKIPDISVTSLGNM